MKRFFVSLAALVAATLVGCASLGPQTVRIPEAQLQALLAQQFPRQQRLLEVIDVHFAPPRLRLLPERNRIATELDFNAADHLTGRPWRGSMALDYGLRFEPSDGSVRLADVRVTHAAVESSNSLSQPQAQRLAAQLAERLLEGAVVWRASSQQLRRLRARDISAATVDVTHEGLVIALVPHIK